MTERSTIAFINLQKHLIVCLVLLLLLLSSCGIQQNKFSTQKYTKFRKSRSYKFESNSSKQNQTDSVIALTIGSKTVNESNVPTEQIITDAPDQIDLMDEAELKLDQSIPSQNTESDAEEVGEKNELKPQEVSSPGNPRNFHKLSPKEKAETLIDFNWISNSIIFTVIGAFAFLALGIFLGSVGGYVFAGIFIFTAWITSLVNLTKVKRINAVSQTKAFRWKHAFVTLVAWIGITSCIVTLLGGIVLLVLWLTRVI